MLSHANAAWANSDTLDTIMRDILADGLARLVFVAYDTLAVARRLPGDQQQDFIMANTRAWFEKRGFVSWYCDAAASCFTRNVLPKRVLKTKAKKQK